MADLIFWYTGAAIWGVIGLVFAIAVLLGGIIGAAQAYRHIGQWTLLLIIGKSDIDAVNRALVAAAGHERFSEAWIKKMQAELMRDD